MKVIYDQETDSLDVILREGRVAESDEAKPGIILDFDGQGNLISIEILDASKRLGQPIGVSFELSASKATAADA